MKNIANYYNDAEELTSGLLKAKLYGIMNNHNPLKYIKSENANWYDENKLNLRKALVIPTLHVPMKRLNLVSFNYFIL